MECTALTAAERNLQTSGQCESGFTSPLEMRSTQSAVTFGVVHKGQFGRPGMEAMFSLIAFLFFLHTHFHTKRKQPFVSLRGRHTWTCVPHTDLHVQFLHFCFNPSHLQYPRGYGSSEHKIRKCGNKYSLGSGNRTRRTMAIQR